MNTSKWKKAVIHLEAVGNDKNYYNELVDFNEEMIAFKNGESKLDPFSKRGDLQSKTNRFHGTAIFFIHEDKRYLLTAMHVLHDQLAGLYYYDEHFGRFEHNEQHDIYLQELSEEFEKRSIFNNIFTVPSLKHYLNRNLVARREHLMNLSSGPPSVSSYTYDHEHDLGIISLDRLYSSFADQLVEFGYEPIDIDDVNVELVPEGEDVFTVGYPSAVSIVEKIDIPSAKKNWASDMVSIPVFSFGKVSASEENLPYYWADLNISAGNSGGPLVCNNKLIGILTHQALTDLVPNFVDGDETIAAQLSVGIPHSKAARAQLIIDLLFQQIKKDNFLS